MSLQWPADLHSIQRTWNPHWEERWDDTAADRKKHVLKGTQGDGLGTRGERLSCQNRWNWAVIRDPSSCFCGECPPSRATDNHVFLKGYLSCHCTRWDRGRQFAWEKVVPSNLHSSKIMLKTEHRFNGKVNQKHIQHDIRSYWNQLPYNTLNSGRTDTI